MLLIAILLLPSLAFAAPVLEKPEKSDVEVKLSANNLNAVEVTIQNNGKQPLELAYRVTPLEHVVVELRGENGKQCKVEYTGDRAGQAEPGTLTIPAGQSKTLSVHTCHSLPELGDLDQKVTFIARLKYAGRSIESKPLTLDP